MYPVVVSKSVLLEKFRYFWTSVDAKLESAFHTNTLNGDVILISFVWTVGHGKPIGEKLTEK